MKMKNTLTDEQVYRSLKRLEQGWPSHLWLYSADGVLHVMRTDEDGKRVVCPGDEFDPEYIARSFRIPSDGGDW
ncbi:MAG: hypothetical protein HQL75_00180 [Magnetococcales bacterium]|nr:hypothetical protein [Magnetococcales bacterium]